MTTPTDLDEADHTGLKPFDVDWWDSNRSGPTEKLGMPSPLPEVLPAGTRWRCTGGINIRQGVFLDGANLVNGEAYHGCSSLKDCEGWEVSVAHPQTVNAQWIDWEHQRSSQPAAEAKATNVGFAACDACDGRTITGPWTCTGCGKRYIPHRCGLAARSTGADSTRRPRRTGTGDRHA